MCVSEANWERSDDCAAIWQVTRRRAALTGRTWREQLVAYSPRAAGGGRPRSPRGRWVQSLRADLGEPVGWAALYPSLPWTAYRDRWADRLAEASTLVSAGESARAPCEPAPDHWGRRHGHEGRAPLYRGWIPVECGRRTVNAFWRVPPRGDGPRPGGAVGRNREGAPRVLPASVARGGR